MLRDKYTTTQKNGANFISLRFLRLIFGLKAHAIGALFLGRVTLMGSDCNAVQRAIILSIAVVCALGNRAFDALICVCVHFPSTSDNEYGALRPYLLLTEGAEFIQKF